LLHRHILPQTRFEHLLAHALRRDHRLIALLGKLSVLLQRRHTRDELGKLLVADHQPAFCACSASTRCVTSESSTARRICGVSNMAGSTFPPSWARMRSCCSRSRRLQFRHAHLAGANGGDFCTDIGIAYVGINAPECERQRNQCQKALGNFLVVANDIKHAQKP
jgi:hypothetical protein